MSTKQAIAVANEKTARKEAAKAAASNPDEVTVTYRGKQRKMADLDKVELGEVGAQEATAKKAALKAGKPVPPTPVLDWMSSTDYTNRKAAAKNGGKGGTGKVNMTDEQIEQVCEELALKGHTSKGAILKQLRGTPRGTRQQRLFPIAERVIERLRKAGKLPEPAAETKAPAKKGAAKRTPAKKAASPASPSELGKQHAAAKRTAGRREVTPRPKRAAKKAVA